MSSSSSHATNLSGTSAFAGLTPVVLAVFLGFLAVGVPLGALSLEVGGNLGFGTIVVGSVIGLQSVPPDQRGRAVGNFIAFADIALGVTGPAVGLATQWGGIATAFLVGAAATLAALLLLPSMKLGTTS